MTTNSVICNYIAEHSDWENELACAPYFLKVKRGEGIYNNLVILNYSQYNSDFSNKLVQEARGIIIDTVKNEVVCWPFRKFANYGESFADSIDWETARVTEKIDGSIMKLWWFEGTQEWVLSTNGMIDAKKVIWSTALNVGKRSFYDMFKDVDCIDYTCLDKDFTYMFELCHPEARVIIKWDKPVLYHTGTRNNKTGKEVLVDIGVQKPKEYGLSNLSDCLKAAGAVAPQGVDKDVPLNPDMLDFEGFVVNDANFNRVKIKSYKYVLMHYMSTQALQRYEAVQICLRGEQSEFLNYFPNHKETIDLYSARVDSLREQVMLLYNEMLLFYNEHNCDRKQLALKFKDRPYWNIARTMILNDKVLDTVLLELSKGTLLRLIVSV